jgi:hypothetical protein
LANQFRFGRGVSDGRYGDCAVVAVVVVIENKTARPQAAGTGRYHLPFNVADETAEVFPVTVKALRKVVGEKRALVSEE